MFRILHIFILFFLAIVTSYAVGANENIAYEHYMQQLIKLSKQNPRYPFATMIIDNKTGKILCEGVNASFLNPTFHGEMMAINHCASKYPKLDWTSTTLITDAELCSMCASAIVWAKIPKVVYGTSIPFLLEHHWSQIGIRAEDIIKQSPFIKGSVVGGVLHEQTDAFFVEAAKLS
jgi:tRNA(adenine34) deaminase